VRILAKRPERVNRRNRRVLNPINNSSSQRANAASASPHVLKPPSNGDDDDANANEETKVGVRKSGSSGINNGGISKVALAEAKSHTPSQQRRRGNLSHKKATTRYQNFQEEI